MKQFDLDKALAGKPVLLRDGSKAFVKFVTPNSASKNSEIVGYRFDNGRYEVVSWSIDGEYYWNNENKLDIVGMHFETINIGGITVPKPETEPPPEETRYYYPLLTSMDRFSYDYWVNSEADNRLLKDGLIHLTEKAAIAHAEVLLKLNKSAMGEAD